MGVYKENKNFINKVVSHIKSLDNSSNLTISRIFESVVDKRVRNDMYIHLKISDVVVEELSERVYICVKLKESQRVVEISYGNHCIQDEAVESFLLRGDTSSQNVINPLRDYLSTKYVKNEDGKAYKDMDNKELIDYLCYNPRFQKEELYDYPEVVKIEKSINDMIDVDIDFSMNDKVFKQIKNHDIFPVLYMDFGVTDSFYIAKRYYNNPMSTRSVFANYSGNDSNYKKIFLGKLLVSNIPFNQWVIVTSRDPKVNIRSRY